MSGDSSIGIGIGLALKSYGRAFRGLLDKYTGAAAAYSLRKLSSSTSNVVRVRRSSDDAEQDFTAAQVDNGTLVNFANNDTSALYGNKMYFDGVDDYVSVAGMTKSVNYFGACTMSATVYVTDTTTNQVVFCLGGASYRLFINTDGNWYVNTSQNTGVAATLGAHTVSVEFDNSGNAISFTLDGVEEWTGSESGSFPEPVFYIGARDVSGLGRFFKGLIYDFSITGSSVKNFAFNGYGNTNADWEDQVGSNNGTVNGSPALYSGQGFDGFVATEYDQSGAVLRDGTQSTTTNQPQIVSNGALVTDGNGNVSTIWDGVNDDLDVVTGFAGLTAANVYAVTDNAGVVTLDTLTAQDISADTNLTTILTSITYDKVTAVIIYPDNTNQSAIQSEINTLFGIA